MTAKIHRHCVKTAGGVSPLLQAALMRVGQVKPSSLKFDREHAKA